MPAAGSTPAGADARGQQTAKWSVALLLVATALWLRWMVLHVGAPFITIDDNTAYEGGFLVWFGNAPPQRMYIESWIYGIVSICVYGARAFQGLVTPGEPLNVVAAAYRDFYHHPEPYTHAYRMLMAIADVGTAFLAYLIAVAALGRRWHGWLALAIPALFLLSYNTIWCGVVARPDTLTAFLATLGVWGYLKSDAGRRPLAFLLSAVALGLAAGMKLHGAFMSVLLCLDLIRIHGLRGGFGKAAFLAITSGTFFVVAAGSLLFDPLTYVKLRAANYSDDAAPWIRWGDHFWTVVGGAGWLAVPLAVVASVRRLRSRDDSATSTVLLLAVGWIVLFLLIRQMRAYWMLPALPLIYCAAAVALADVIPRRATAVLAPLLACAVAWQAVSEVATLRAARYKEATDWIAEHGKGRTIYVLGYDAIFLPRSTTAIRNISTSLERTLREDRERGLPFAVRHVKNWEERSRLVLFDLLGARVDGGYDLYDFYTTPPDRLAGLLDVEAIDVVFLQEGFDLRRVPELRTMLESRFRSTSRVTGAGGGPNGLGYVIFERAP